MGAQLQGVDRLPGYTLSGSLAGLFGLLRLCIRLTKQFLEEQLPPVTVLSRGLGPGSLKADGRGASDSRLISRVSLQQGRVFDVSSLVQQAIAQILAGFDGFCLWDRSGVVATAPW